MSEHEPFDGTVPFVVKMSPYLAPRRWAGFRSDEVPRERFATWREAMDYAMHDTRPAVCCGTCPPIVGGGYDCTCEGNPRCPGPRKGKTND